MKQKVINNIMQGMLGSLNNVQLERLKEVLEHAFFNKQVSEAQEENDSSPANEKLLDGGYTLGGEQNGKVLFPDLSTTADGLITAMELLDALKKSGKTMSELTSVMEKYPQVLINVGILPEYKELWKNNHNITDLIERRQYGLGDDGRIFVREAGDEPVIRVMVEGKSFDKINRYANEISDMIKEETGTMPVLKKSTDRRTGFENSR